MYNDSVFFNIYPFLTIILFIFHIHIFSSSRQCGNPATLLKQIITNTVITANETYFQYLKNKIDLGFVAAP